MWTREFTPGILTKLSRSLKKRRSWTLGRRKWSENAPLGQGASPSLGPGGVTIVRWDTTGLEEQSGSLQERANSVRPLRPTTELES
ncbi:MAG: hypothetical protein ACI9F9_000685 [Candidatus Paceibacteria bacterium]|jgi:hypothetical protein